MTRPTVESSLKDRVRWVRKEAEDLGFDSILEVFKHQLDLIHAGGRRARDYEWFKGYVIEGGYLRIIHELVVGGVMQEKWARTAMAADDSMMDNFIVPLAGARVGRELRVLCKDMSGGLDEVTPETLLDFSFDKLKANVREKAPGLDRILKMAVGVKDIGKDVSRGGDDQLSEDGSGTLSDDRTKDGSGDGEGDDSATGDKRKDKKKEKKSKQKKDRDLMIAVAISIVCYARTNRANLLQGSVIFGPIVESVLIGVVW